MAKPEKSENTAGVKQHEQKPEAPEAHNGSQDDEPAQAQTMAEQALTRATAVLGDEENGSVSLPSPSAMNQAEAPDLRDKMEEMRATGEIDYNAYDLERKDNDEESGA